MKKKLSMAIIAVVLAVAVIFVPSVKTFAVSTLSIFRVDETKSIKITLADLEEMIAYFQQHEGNAEYHAGDYYGGRKMLLEQYKEQHPDFAAKYPGNDGEYPGFDAKHPAFSDKYPGFTKEQADLDPDKTRVRQPEYKTLDHIRDFKAFSFHLPRAQSGEQPELYAFDARETCFKLDTAVINEHLSHAGISTRLDGAYDGAEVAVHFPAVIAAKYSDVILLATQRIAVDAPGEALNSLWAGVLELPFIPENVRRQLAEIDPQSPDVYVPVLLGIGRETVIGGVVGYIYSVKDLEQLRPILPEIQGAADSEDYRRHMADLRNDVGDTKKHFEGSWEQLADTDAAVLIWTKNGVLYVLAGQKTDSELTEIARSVR